MTEGRLMFHGREVQAQFRDASHKITRYESGLNLVEQLSPEVIEQRRFFEHEVAPVAALTPRFSDFTTNNERFPFVGGKLLSHTIDLTRRTYLTVTRENNRRQRTGEALLNKKASLFTAKFEDLDEVYPDNPHPDEATNGKSHNHREQALAQFYRMVDRSKVPEFQQLLIRRIEPLIQKVPTLALPREARLVKVLEHQQHAIENGLYPFVELQNGHQQLRFQHELVFDVGWHVLEKLLREGQEFPITLEPIMQYRDQFIWLVEHYHQDTDQVQASIATLMTINSNRHYPDTDEIVARMEQVLEQLHALPDLALPSEFSELEAGQFRSVERAS